VSALDRPIPGTTLFDGEQAQRGYALNRMCYSFGNIYYLAKLGGIFGLNVQDLGAQQTGVSVEAFKARLKKAGE